MSDPIKLIITDDEELFRKGMVQLVSEHEQITVVGEAANGQPLLNLLDRKSVV